MVTDMFTKPASQLAVPQILVECRTAISFLIVARKIRVVGKMEDDILKHAITIVPYVGMKSLHFTRTF